MNPVADRLAASGRCLVMGVVNVTPDSFSDGGRWADTRSAVGRGLALLDDGADLLDVGGESTRPGATAVDGHTEAGRAVPVVAELAAAGAVVSIDTYRASTAAAALDAGASLVNDVTGGLGDPAMASILAERGVPCVLMHSRGASDAQARYGDVVTEVRDELRARLDAVVAAGVDPARVVLDPGLGFAKDPAHNWALLAHLPSLLDVGCPVLVGASRKRFLGSLLPRADGSLRPADERDDATAAVTALAAASGAWAVRVHEVRASADAVRVVAALAAARAGRS